MQKLAQQVQIPTPGQQARAQQGEADAMSSPSYLNDMAGLAGPLGQALLPWFTKIMSGTTEYGGGQYSGHFLTDPYAASQVSDQQINNKAFAGIRDSVYNTAAKLESRGISEYLARSGMIRDRQELAGTVDTVMRAKRWMANSPLLAMFPQLRSIPFLRDNASDITREVVSGLSDYGLNHRSADPELLQRAGQVATHAVAAMMNTETGKRRPSDVAGFLRYQMAQGVFGKAISDAKSFATDAVTGAKVLTDAAKNEISKRFRRDYASAERLAHLLGQERRPLAKVWDEFGTQVLGRPVDDGDVRDINRLVAARDSAGLGGADIRPFISETVKRLAKSGIPQGNSLKYLTQALNQYAAMARPSQAGGEAMGYQAGKGMMGASPAAVIRDLIAMNVAMPVAGVVNPKVVAGAALLGMRGAGKALDGLHSLMRSGADDRQVLGFLARNGALADDKTARRVAYTRMGEQAYNRIMDAGGSVFMARQFANTVAGDVGKEMSRGGRNAGNWAQGMWNSYTGGADAPRASVKDLYRQAQLSDMAEQVPRKYGLSGGGVVSAIAASPDYHRNLVEAQQRTEQAGSEYDSQMYPTTRKPSAPSELPQALTGAYPEIGTAAGPEVATNQNLAPGGEEYRLPASGGGLGDAIGAKVDESLHAPASATPAPRTTF